MKIKTGCIGKKTFVQALALSLVGGPICWALGMGGGSFIWCCCAMFCAPILVDAIKPVIVE